MRASTEASPAARQPSPSGSSTSAAISRGCGPPPRLETPFVLSLRVRHDGSTDEVAPAAPKHQAASAPFGLCVTTRWKSVKRSTDLRQEARVTGIDPTNAEAPLVISRVTR